jgi:ABC-2 type transport system permease protein
MFRSIWSKTLRDYRVAILSWGIGLGLLMIVGFATATPAVLTAFISLAPLLHFLGDPYALQTPEGYITFRYLGAFLPLMLSIWPILAGARMVRGEEEHSTIDVLLAMPQSRVRLLLEKMGALVIALLLIAVLFALGVVAGEASLGGHVDVIRALLAGLNLSGLAFFFGMLSLLLSQFTTSRGVASGSAGALLLFALVLDITGREVNGSWVQYLSPFYYYNRNRPLIASFYDQPWAALLLLGLAVACAVLSLILFARRDIGRPLFSWQRKPTNGTEMALRSLSRAEHAISTRTVSSHTLCADGWSAFWWLLGIVAFCAYCILLTPSVQEPFSKLVQQTPWLQQIFFDMSTNTNAALLGTIAFSFLPALVVIFALVLALKWSADLENGRLELVLSTPNSRVRILLERFGMNVLMILLAPILTWLILLIGAQLINLPVDQSKVMAASFSMLPLALITIGLVYAASGRLRYGAVLGLITAYLVLAFLEETLEGMAHMPSWLISLSIFHLYGNPVFQGMNWNNFLGMMGVAVALLVLSVIQFRYADVGLG